MAGHDADAPIDVVRKLAILGVLIGAVVLLHRFAVPTGDFDRGGLVALGFLVLAAKTVGELAVVARLPHITGYLVSGIVLGPSMAAVFRGLVPPGWELVHPFDVGVLNESVLRQLGLLDALALGLIAITAGGELKLEQLRHGMKLIGAGITGHAVAVFVGVTAYVAVVGLFSIPGFSVPALAGLSVGQVFALGAVVASVSMATSPPVTIAVINAAGAKGEVTSTVLSSVVLLDVCVVVVLSAANLLATSMFGISDGATLLAPLMHIASALVLGALLGGVIHAYLRYVGVEILLFLVAVIYTTSFVAREIHAEPVLVFIVAGFLTANFSSLGDQLIHEVEKLATPVYVVFFALAGAKLQLDVLAATLLLAAGLVAVRMASTWLGVSAAVRIAGGGRPTQKYAWLGFVSQAGLALGLASVLRDTFAGDLGASLYSLLVASVAINTLVGPPLLQFALHAAGETKGAAEPRETGAVADDEEDSELEAWGAPEALPDPWGPPLALAAPHLVAAVTDLEAELQGVVRDLARGPLEDLREDAEEYLRSLRREFLRQHRRAVVRVQTGEALTGLVPSLRSEVGELGERWRSMVLARVARARRAVEDPAQAWSPLAVVAILDELADALPEGELIPVEPEQWARRDDDGVLRRFRRGLLRGRARLLRPRRELNLRSLGRYHLGGRAPGRLEGLASLLVQGELHLAARTSALFDEFAAVWEDLARLAAEEVGADRMLDALAHARREVDQDFALASEELDRVVADGANRAALALGGLVRDLKDDALVIGTLDLPHWRRRPGRVFRDRSRGLEALGPGLVAARGAVVARWSALALELELVGLLGRVKDVVEIHGAHLARLVRGRGTTQLERVDEALTETLRRVEARVDDPSLHADLLASALRAEAEPFARLVSDATRTSRGLVEQLSDETWITPLTQALLAAAQDLTEWYTVPTGRRLDGEWSLPTEVTTTEVPFREVVVGYVEASVTKDLLGVTRDLGERASSLVAACHELERVVAFNVELACAELDVLPPGESIPDETRELVREMVLGAVGRTHQRLRGLVPSSAQWADEAHAAVREAVVHELEHLRGQLLDGRMTELRLLLLRESEVRSRLVRRAGSLRGLLPAARDWALGRARAAVGDDRIETARAWAGLPGEARWQRPLHVVLAPPSPRQDLPVVYRRLFSDQALEAGDLLTGRQEEVARARAALDGSAGARYRSAALLGTDPVGVAAVVNAVIRGSEARRVRRIELRRPTTAEEVAAWFDDGDGDDDGLVVLAGLRWLFELRPGGFRPLERLVEGLVADGGHTRWLIAADRCVWGYASRVVPLDPVVGDVITLRALGPDELASAILSRQAMSGYAVTYASSADLGWQLELLRARGQEEEDRSRAAWFHTLHAASDGVLHDALRLWMAAIESVDESAGALRVGQVPRPPLARLQALPDDVHMVLLQALRQGWMTPELLAGQLRVPVTHARVTLGGLAHQGLLVADADTRFLIAPHLRTPIERVLRARGWAP